MDSHKKEARELLGLSLIFIFILALLYAWALESFLFWVYPWFDNLTHFLGGLWAGFFGLWIYYFSGLFKTQKFDKKFVLILSLLIVLVVGLSWEVFKVVVWDVYKESNYVKDTLGDILLDIVGGLLAYRYFVFHFIEKHK